MMTLATNNSLNAAAATANAGSKMKAPAGVKTTADAANEALTAKAGSNGMGQKDFLTLFTTQLKCQDPLDPVKNEAFVAQLAQFSQLEATTSMSETLKAYVDSMSGERMMSSTSMIGKTVSVPGAPAVITPGGKPVQGFVSLPTGAEGVKFEVFNAKGQMVTSQIMGSQPIGDMPWAWDGTNESGAQVPAGNYSFKATVISQGKTSNPSVNVLSVVTGVNQQADKTVMLEVAGGKSVKLTDVQRIGS
jgi:flagellar basal-body rod modification protein FlgD